MNINGLLKGLPVNALWQILRVFRFTTRWYEQIEVAYYAKLADHAATHENEQNIRAEELAPVFVLSTVDVVHKPCLPWPNLFLMPALTMSLNRSLLRHRICILCTYVPMRQVIFGSNCLVLTATS